MGVGIRGKLIGTLGAATIIPMLVGILFIESLGRRYYAAQQGAIFKIAAAHAADTLTQVITNQTDALDAWLELSEIAALLTQDAGDLPTPSSATEAERIRDLDERWPSLAETDVTIQAFLANGTAHAISDFKAMYPLFVEVFVTDTHGRLVAASNKISDYWQADEEWWQRAAKLTRHGAWLEGISFDESAGVHSIDVAMPVFAPGQENGAVVGVIKGVLDISPLLTSVHTVPAGIDAPFHVVTGDGRVLAGLGRGGSVSPLQERIPVAATDRLELDQSGWAIEDLTGRGRELMGFASVRVCDGDRRERDEWGVIPMYVIVHQAVAAVLTPVHRALWRSAAIGAGILLAFIALGLFLADREIVRPLRILYSAAHSMTLRAKTESVADVAARQRMSIADKRARTMVSRVAEIHTGDEIEQLAQGFGLMATRVLDYHQQLEREIEQRSEEINSDLKMAREFQEALLPRHYPRITGRTGPAPLALRFAHAYKPALSVGGDFFEIVRLSDSRAGVLVADVVGHGTRAALITAVLRTLVRDLVGRATRPAHLLSLMNKHFYDIMPHDNTLIFATALYIVWDVKAKTVVYCSAGHLSPLVADRGARSVTPLFREGEINPAMGLFRESTYADYERPLGDGNVFVMFTDGAVEAHNPQGEDFGEQRLAQVVKDSLGKGVDALVQSALESLHGFMDTVLSPDDICIVAVEAAAADMHE